MNALQRYVFRQVLVTAIFVAFGMTALVTLFGSLRLVDFIVNRGLPVSVLLELAGLRIPGFLAIILPLATVAAILVVYNRLISESELVVMRSAGVSQWRLAVPGLFVALLVTLVSYGFTLYVTPKAYATFKEQQFKYRNAFGSILLQEGRFNSPIDGVTVFARSREARGDMRGIFAHDARDPEQPVTYMAERATATQTDGGIRVVLFKGSRQQVDKSTGGLTLFYFDQYSLDLGTFNSTGENRWSEPEERFLPELLNPGDSEAEQYYRTDLIAEGHKRLASPLFVFAFGIVALAVLIGGDFNRRGQTVRILVAIGLVIILQLSGLGVFNFVRRSLVFMPLMYAVPICAILAASFEMTRGSRPRRRPLSGADLSAAGA